jgi:hypothetical protein
MAKTYYNFAERSADSQINWAEVGKNVTDMLNTEASIREEKKAAIDEASRQYGEVLANAPTGDFKAANEWTLDFANDAAQMRLMQDRLLKSGRLSVRDYTVQRQNLNDGTNQMFAVSKEYQEKAKELMERYELGQSQETEAWLMEQIQGLSNFTNTKAYINPTNSQISLAKMVKKVGADGKEVMMMDDNPDNYMSINQLRNRMNVKLDKYDYVKAVDGQVSALGDVLKTSVTKLKGAYRMLRIDEMTDPTLRSRLSDEDKKTLTAYQEWEGNMIKAELANPFNQLGLLTDAIDKVPGTNDFYEPTFDAKLASSNPKYILLEDDGSGMIRPKFTEDQTKAATDFLRAQTRNAVDQQTKTDLQAEPAIQFDPYRQYENKTKVSLGADEKKNVSYYEKANNAMRTGNVGALNTDDYSFHFEKGANGEKSVMYVATNREKGRKTDWNKENKDEFKAVTNANDLASYLAGIDPKKAQQVYEEGKKGFQDIHGFTLFGTYLGEDFTKTLDELYSPSTYTEEAREDRRGSGSSKSSGGGAAASGGKPRG